MQVDFSQKDEYIQVNLNNIGLDINVDFDSSMLLEFVKGKFREELILSDSLLDLDSMVSIYEKYFGEFNKRAKRVIQGLAAFCYPTSISSTWLNDNIATINKEMNKKMIKVYKKTINLSESNKDIEELYLLTILTKLDKIKSKNYNKEYKEIGDLFIFLGDWKKKYLNSSRSKIVFRDNIHVKKIKKLEELAIGDKYLTKKLKKQLLESSETEYDAWVDKRIKKFRKLIDELENPTKQIDPWVNVKSSIESHLDLIKRLEHSKVTYFNMIKKINEISDEI